jgi:hypothetical protein
MMEWKALASPMPMERMKVAIGIGGERFSDVFYYIGTGSLAKCTKGFWREIGGFLAGARALQPVLCMLAMARKCMN